MSSAIRRSGVGIARNDGAPDAGSAFAVMASGAGTNAQALFDAVRDGRICAPLACLVCDRPGAPVVERARAAGVEVLEFAPAATSNRSAYELELVAQLRARGVAWVVLAGYMRICGDIFLTTYGGRTINVHPSLLPAFPGRDAIGDALAAGVNQTGVTVHFIDEGVDTGPVIAQRAVAIRPGDTRDSLAARVHAVEHELLPAVTANLVARRIDFPTSNTTTTSTAHQQEVLT
jgi:phosphoribosylglycinamide formyltransferase-1